MIKMLMADDHCILRRSMKHLFESIDDISIVAEASNGNEVLDALPNGTFDIILLDLSMSGISGVHLISQINTDYPRLPILVLSMHNEPQIARRAINAGAAGYLTKDNEPEVLVNAIRKVVDGGRFIEPLLAEKMIFSTSDEEKPSLHESLSKREYEILLLIAQGQSLSDIANLLFISSKTVSTYKMRLMQKMEMSNTADLVRYVMSNNLM